MRALAPAGEIVPGQFLGVGAPLPEARFAVLLLPYERSTSYKKGTKRGPQALLEGSLGLELWDEEIGRQTYREGIHTLSLPPGPSPAERYFPRVGAMVESLLSADRTLFAIGGEHSLSQAVIPPYIRRFQRLGRRLSVFHFDAHADMRPAYEGSPHNHACAMYPISRLCRVVQAGIRSIAEEEAHLVNAGNVITFTRHDNPDVSRLLARVLKSLTDDVYISIDLDGFDPAVIPGVGTPQPGGFSWSEGLELFRAVISAKNVVGVDVMELCPLKDTVTSELAAAKLVYRLMGMLAAKRAAAPAGARHGRKTASLNG